MEVGNGNVAMNGRGTSYRGWIVLPSGLLLKARIKVVPPQLNTGFCHIFDDNEKLKIFRCLYST